MVEVCTGIQMKEWPFIVGAGEDHRYFIDSLKLCCKIKVLPGNSSY